MDQPSATPKEIKRPGKKRRRSGFTSLLLFLVFIAVVAGFVWAEQKRREAVADLNETREQLENIKNSTQTSGDEKAEQVLTAVRRHIDIPTDPAPTVATIVDVDKLKESSAFYEKAKNNDNLIITERRAILYDPDRDVIIDVVPVQIDNTQPSPSPSPADSSPTPTATPEPSAEPTPTSSPLTF